MSDEKLAKDEILEAIAAIVVVAKCGKSVLADGKVSVADLPALIALVQKQSVLVEGAKGLDHINLKEISADQVVEIVVALVAAVKEVQAA